jgi:predicted amidophosphoribosyltransferase
VDVPELIHALFPRACHTCGGSLSPGECRDGICRCCRQTLEIRIPGELSTQSDGIDFFGFYAGHLATILISFKRGRQPGAHRIFAGLFIEPISFLVTRLSESHPGVPVVLTWPPGAPLPALNRGYDHMQRIASAVVKRFRANAGMTPIAERMFVRRSPVQQKSLDRCGRLINARRAIALRRKFADPGMIRKDSIIIILDDVTTTGATLNACVDLLRRAGYRRLFPRAFLKD